MRLFSRSWISSTSRRKQRKYRYNAPYHIRQSFLASHLSKELKQKYHKRSMPVRVGDKVKIMRGQFRKKTGTVERVSLKTTKLFITGIDAIKRDGSKALYPLDPSNVQIIELQLEDKKRKKNLERQGKTYIGEKVRKEQKKSLKKKQTKTTIHEQPKESP